MLRASPAVTHIAARGLAILLASVALVGCEGAPSPDRGATPTRTLTVRDAPVELLLQLQEMPAGYYMTSNKPVTLELISQGFDRSLGRAEITQRGFVSGAFRTFVNAGRDDTAVRSAGVYLLIYKDQAAAKAALDISVPSDPQIAKVGIGETIGDSSIGYRVSDRDNDRDVYVVLLRYANAVAYVHVAGNSSSVTLKEAAALARKEIAILRADTEGPPRSTPTPRSSPIFPAMSGLALRADDLTGQWTPGSGRPISASDLGLPEQLVSEIGFRSGWSKTFQSSDGAISVNSLVLLVGNGTKATRGVRAIVDLAIGRGVPEISVGEQIGDLSTGLEGVISDPRAGSTNGMVVRSVCFAYADSIAILTVTAKREKTDAEFAADLARKLLAHLV